MTYYRHWKKAMNMLSNENRKLSRAYSRGAYSLDDYERRIIRIDIKIGMLSEYAIYKFSKSTVNPIAMKWLRTYQLRMLKRHSILFKMKKKFLFKMSIYTQIYFWKIS